MHLRKTLNKFQRRVDLKCARCGETILPSVRLCENFKAVLDRSDVKDSHFFEETIEVSELYGFGVVRSVNKLFDLANGDINNYLAFKENRAFSNEWDEGYFGGLGSRHLFLGDLCEFVHCRCVVVKDKNGIRLTKSNRLTKSLIELGAIIDKSITAEETEAFVTRYSDF